MVMDNDKGIYTAALYSLYFFCAPTILSLQFLAAPYGKHARPGYGITIPPAVAWLLMESPTLWLTLLLYPRGRHRSNPIALALISPYLIHYIHRTLIYPLRIKNRSKPSSFPLSIALTAFSFNLLNAYIQTRSVSHYADYGGGWRWGRMAAGLAVFVWGMAVNIRSDLALVKLKKEGGGGYRIPSGGWFEMVSCPNYMGEAVEWLGWAVICWSPAALAFFLYTCSNLVPRARAHHRWYLEKFGADYPKKRKAVVPFLF